MRLHPSTTASPRTTTAPYGSSPCLNAARPASIARCINCSSVCCMGAKHRRSSALFDVQLGVGGNLDVVTREPRRDLDQPQAGGGDVDHGHIGVNTRDDPR